MNLRPYQVEGKRRIYEEWDFHDVLFYVLATGGGKTVQFMDIIRDMLLLGKRVMLIAHREELIGQAWLTLFHNGIEAGVIQSDTKTNYKLPVQVCSIQTIVRRSELPHADVIIIDEGHHAQPDNGYGKILNRYPFAKVLLVSATPYRLSGEGFLNLAPGRTTRLIVNSTLKMLIDEGWLVPLKYMLASIPDLKDVTLSKGDYNEEKSRKAMQFAPLVESVKDHAPGKQGVSFGVNVEHSIEMSQQFNAEGIPSEHLDANTKKDKRKWIITDFKAGLLKNVCNVGIFTEGTDFPNCDYVQLARPTKSLTMFLQMVGRGTRAVPGLVDRYGTAIERKEAIANSTKPQCIILDNGGLWLDHGFPEDDRNWQHYFEGWKDDKKKKLTDEEMEILVYVAEDKNGVRFRTSNIKEIEGMQLIEATREVRRKAINIKSINEFDKTYAIFCKSGKMKKPGYMAVRHFIQYCQKHSILMVPEIWGFMKKRLVADVERRKMDVAHNYSRFPGMYPQGEYEKTLERIDAQGVAESFLYEEYAKYEKKNSSAIAEYLRNRKNEVVQGKVTA